MLKGKIVIPLGKLREGTETCIKNGQRLHMDAYILYKNKGYISSYVLSTLAVEEYGKAVLLLRALVEKRGVTNAEYGDIFSGHVSKLGATLMQMVDILPKEEDRKKTREWFKEMASHEHKRKLTAMYVDWHKKGKRWSSPMDIGDEDAWARANQAKRTASLVWHFVSAWLKTSKIGLQKRP